MSGDQSKDITTYSVEKWVEAVSSGTVVLPMIQRGSVWKPHQVLDLWDTLLQGMPLGAFMTSPVKPGAMVFNVRTRETLRALPGAISLLDGQQRTLAMLSAWPGVETDLQRRVGVWVDLGEEPPAEYRFRLWAATRAQPFGYERTGIGGQALSRLSSAELRIANSVYTPDRHGADEAIALWDHEDAFMPWRSTFPIRLSRLIENQIDLDDIAERIVEKERAIQRLLEKRRDHGSTDEVLSEIQKRIAKLEILRTKELDVVSVRARKLQEAVMHMRSVSFPLIPAGRYLDEAVTGDGDPPIAVLFKRVAVGGQPLSNEDYIFSVLKHHEPDVHTLVESLLAKPPIAALYTANALVMAAVRAHLLDLRKNANDEKAFRDAARIDKARFSRLAQDKEYDFSGGFKELIGKDGRFVEVVERLLAAIAYSSDFKEGLPLHAIPWLVDRYLFDVLISWFLQSNTDPASVRLPIVRFLLWGFLCIKDKATASEFCISEIPRLIAMGASFPIAELMSSLIRKDLAYALPSPNAIKKMAFTEPSSEGPVLRGASRFIQEDGVSGHAADVYRRWWNLRGNRHEHAFLLWLQRGFVSEEFGRQAALAGMEEDTPYDFDHILPQSNWGWWTGIVEHRLIDFATDKKSDHWVLGNAIGNLRVWPLRLNRQDGDASPAEKIRLQFDASDGSDGDCKRQQSLIENGPQVAAWVGASGEGQFVKHSWDRTRAVAFQLAVESRTFSLYKSFYADLRFADLATTFAEALVNKEKDAVSGGA